MIAIIILIVVVILILASCIKIVPQANAYVVERLGAYQGTWEVGIHFKMPIIDRVAKRVLLKEQVVDFSPQPVITKDHRSEAVFLWCGESDHGDRKSDSNNIEKYYR